VRVLVLSNETPAHPGGGGPSRQHSLLELLAATHDIRVLSTGGTPRVGRLPSGVDVRLVATGDPPPLFPGGGWLRRNLTHYLSREPRRYRTQGHHLTALGEALGEQLADFRPDLVQLEHSELAGLVRMVRPGIATVVVLHNLLVELAAQQLRPGHPAKVAQDLLEVPITWRRERFDLRGATRIVVVSRRDQRMLRWLGGHARSRVVPNCVPAEYFAPADGVDSERAKLPTLVLAANFSWPPNQQAATVALRDILPAVQRSVPNAELLLVGQQIPDWLVEMQEQTPGAHATGTVPDARPYLRRSWVALAPLRGAGTPLKVLEALASGIPVIGTPRVARALELGPEDGVLVARTAAGMARLAASLLRDQDRRDRLATAGVAVVRARFDRRHAAELLERVWTEAVAEVRSRDLATGGPAS